MLIYKNVVCSCIHLCVHFLFFLPFNAQHVSNEVHNVVVLVGELFFEIHVKDVECVRFRGSKKSKSVIRTLNVAHVFH